LNILTVKGFHKDHCYESWHKILVGIMCSSVWGKLQMHNLQVDHNHMGL